LVESNNVKKAIKVIDDLLKAEIGNPERLKSIKEKLENKITITAEDVEYLQEKREELGKIKGENVSYEKIDDTSEIQKKVNDLEEKISKKDDSWRQEHYKSLGITLALSLIVGWFLLGIVYFYLGKNKRGGIFLIIEFVIVIPMYFIPSLAMYPGGIIFFILWLWQVIGSYRTGKDWNISVAKGILP